MMTLDKYVLECFNREYDYSFRSHKNFSQDQFAKNVRALGEWFFDVKITELLHPPNLSLLSKLFNNRQGDDMTLSDVVFVAFMERFTNVCLAKCILYYGSEFEVYYKNVCLRLSTIPSRQFSTNLNFYNKNFTSSLPNDANDIYDLFVNVPMLVFYYLLLSNITQTNLSEDILLIEMNERSTTLRRTK